MGMFEGSLLKQSPLWSHRIPRFTVFLEVEVNNYSIYQHLEKVVISSKGN